MKYEDTGIDLDLIFLFEKVINIMYKETIYESRRFIQFFCEKQI